MAEPRADIEVRGVSKTYGGGRGAPAVPALDDVSLTVQQGEFVSLIGPSGCGKSTLLRLIGDIIEPSAGNIRVRGKEARRARLDRDYGMVFQSPNLFDWRTVSRNVELPLELMRARGSARRERGRGMLSSVGLRGFEGSYPWQLSGGMQQRVSISRALSFKPSILLMDEPFGALDEMTRDAMNMELVRVCAEANVTCVLVTHSIPEAVFLSDRVVVLSARPGRILQVLDVPLPRPRSAETRELPAYYEAVNQVRHVLRSSEF